MILLLGGTSDALRLANRLYSAGYEVMLSTLTSWPQAEVIDPGVHTRYGRLDESTLSKLIHRQNIRLIVDATHPYAARAQQTALYSCLDAKIPYLRCERPESIRDKNAVDWADSHIQAAFRMLHIGKPTLLTIGSRNLSPYVQAASSGKIPLFARILDRQEPITTAVDAGIPATHLITCRPPCSFTENLSHIDAHHIEVLVTKDSGPEGGMDEKLAAAKERNLKIIVIKRPARPDAPTCRSSEILPAVHILMSGDHN